MVLGLFDGVNASPPPRPPNHWEMFGFDGPTNKHNLDLSYAARLRESWIGEGQEFTLRDAYDKCLKDLEASHPSWIV